MIDQNKKLDEMPFIAPCRHVSVGAPLRWLKQGLLDVKSAPLHSLGYGIVMSLLIMSVLAMAWQFGSAWIMISMLCGFVFLAPIACIGTYAISAQLERKQPVSLKQTMCAALKRHIATVLVFTLMLLIVFLVWARASSMASIFLPSTGTYEFAEMMGYSIILGLVSLLFLSITFSVSAFSLPMIMHRDVDAVTAVVTSINAVLRNKLTMLIWGFLIAFGVLIGILSFGILLIIILPAVGHAVWHSYLDTIDASAFPRHSEGITAVRRAEHI